ncbi:lipocalin-like domain-containing protein [Salipaludibacillus sp. HK11]|uniref:lipocalin-like domain-containing protein n=1 Tax=Salipaludibacillus sp. HK11 TaxID=3394320 RepID=UPI0039FD36D9
MSSIKKCTFIMLIMLLTISPLTVLGDSSSSDESEPEFRNASVHDPSIIKADDMFYAIGSHIDGAKSEDLINWDNFTNGYTTPGNTLYGDLSENLAGSFEWAGEDDGDSSGGFAVWAPEIIWNDHYVNGDGSNGAYMMYYSASSTYIRSAIGYAVSQDVEGPFEYVDTIMYSDFHEEEGVTDENSDVDKHWSNTNIPDLIVDGVFDEPNSDWFQDSGRYNYNIYTNSIDANLFFDEDGKMWMTYGSWAGGMFILEVDPTTGQPKYPGEDGETEDGRMIDRYFGTKISGGYGRSGEGPYVVYDEDTGYYYLYVTYGGLAAEGGYQMRQFRSENPDGPYVDAAGDSALLPDEVDDGESRNRPGTHDHNILGNKMMGNFLFTRELGEPGSGSGTGYMAPGHNSYYTDSETGEEFLVFHTRFPGQGEMHEIRVHQMVKNTDEWPVPTPYRYAGETLETVNDEEVIGEYKYINHGTEITGELTESSWIELKEDQTVTGDVTGTWEKYDDYRVALTLDDDGSFDGVFLRQWDPTTEEWVMTFSAMSNEGIVVWGSETQSMSDEDAVQSTHDSIDLGDLESVVSSISLPVNGAGGATISWSSSNEEVISSSGQVTRPEAGELDEEVTLTATVTKGDVSEEQEFNLIVLSKREPRLVAYYDFEGDLQDQTGQEPSGTITGDRIDNDGGTITFEEGKEGDAAYFDGESGVRLPNGLISSDQYSIGFWVKPEVITGFTTTFFGARNDDSWISLVPEGPGGSTMLWSNVNGQFYDGNVGSDDNLQLDEWSHVTIANDNGELVIYINGEESNTHSEFNEVFTTLNGMFALAVNYWDTPFQGWIDELVIYDDKALTRDEVGSLFNGDIPLLEEVSDPEGDDQVIYEPDEKGEIVLDEEEVEEGAELEIHVSGSNGTVTIDGDLIRNKKASLNFKYTTDADKIAQVKFPSAIFERASGEVSFDFSHESVEDDSLSDHYSFSINADGIDSSNFTEKVTLGIPVNDLPENVNLDKLDIYNHKNGEWIFIGGSYDEEGFVEGKTNHFSTFAILETTVELDLENQINELIKRIEELENNLEVENLDEKVQSLEQEINDIEAAFKELESITTNQENMLSVLQAELETLKGLLSDSDSSGSSEEDNGNNDSTGGGSNDDTIAIEAGGEEKDTQISESEQQKKDGETLPDTATNTFNYMLFGILLLLLGGIIGGVVYYKKRKKLTE